MVGLQSDLTKRFDSCDEILLESMSALGHLFFEGNDSITYLTARQKCQSLCLVEPSFNNGNIRTIVDYITALILLSYIEYGANNEQQASFCLTKASELALHYGFNLIDATKNQVGQNQPLLLQYCQEDQHIIEEARRVWWEVSEILLMSISSILFNPLAPTALSRRCCVAHCNKW